jgi:hypothetical protein
MNAKRVALVVLASVLLFAARAGAQDDEDPSGESDPSAADDVQPSVDAPAPVQAPPAETAPGPAPATPPDADAAFGSVGQIAISDDLQMFVRRMSTEGRTGDTTRIQLRPAVDFFAVPNLSIGAQLIIGYETNDTPEMDSAVELGLLARLGYNIDFSPTVSLWPRIAIGYRHVSGALSPGGSSSSIDAVPFQLYVPVIVHLASHFFVGGGAMVATDLYYKAEGIYGPKETIIGLQSTIGGYFRGF